MVMNMYEEYEKFEMLTLNEENVNRIFRACLASESTKSSTTYQLYRENTNHVATFDDDEVKGHLETIRYLIGQLSEVHKESEAFSLKASVVRYDQKPWTKDMVTLIHFYYLGIATGDFSSIDDATKMINLSDCTPSLDPNDPKFDQWLEDDLYGDLWNLTRIASYSARASASARADAKSLREKYGISE